MESNSLFYYNLDINKTISLRITLQGLLYNFFLFVLMKIDLYCLRIERMKKER